MPPKVSLLREVLCLAAGGSISRILRESRGHIRYDLKRRLPVALLMTILFSFLSSLDRNGSEQ